MERSLASSRTTMEKLKAENGELAAKLLQAEKKIPAPRALLHVRDLSENVEELRRSLGPLGEDITCTQCTLYLGKAREAERERELAEQSVVEEQRRLVKMSQDGQRVLDAKLKEAEYAATEKVAEEKKRTAKAEKRLHEAEAKLKENSGKTSEVHQVQLEAKDKELAGVRVICDRKLAAKNERIEHLEKEAAQAQTARAALSVVKHLLASHRFGNVPDAERVKSTYEDAVRVVHSRGSVAEITATFARLADALTRFSGWLKSDEAANDMQRERFILSKWAAGLEHHVAVLDKAQLSLDTKDAFHNLREAWNYAYKILMSSRG